MQDYGSVNNSMNTTSITNPLSSSNLDSKPHLKPFDSSPEKFFAQEVTVTIEDSPLESEIASKGKNLISGWGFISVEFWQSYFDINQTDIKERILASLNPLSPKFSEIIWEKPDLYGPFWIASF